MKLKETYMMLWLSPETSCLNLHCLRGGATEMACSVRLAEKAKTIEGIEQYPYQAVADAFEVIPRTLIQNCGGNQSKCYRS